MKRTRVAFIACSGDAPATLPSHHPPLPERSANFLTSLTSTDDCGGEVENKRRCPSLCGTARYA
jgi:hypothetical protein